MAVAVVETFDRLHPLAVPSDANAVAVMFEVPSPWKMARVVDVYSLPVGVLKTSTIQFDPSDDGCTLTPIACGVPPGPEIAREPRRAGACAIRVARAHRTIEPCELEPPAPAGAPRPT